MTLPKLSHPIHKIKIPSLKKEYKFRPFLVKEEKLLLMAKEEDDISYMLTVVKQIIEICSLDSSLDINKLAVFDLEYIFIKLRAISVDNIVKLPMIDKEDNKNYDFEVDLNSVEVKFPDKINNKIELSKETGLVMKYPPSTLFEDKEFMNTQENYVFELIIRCLDKIYEGDIIYNPKDYDKKEIEEFIGDLSVKTYNQIQEFLLNVPKITHEIKYKNSLGHDRKIVLSSLNDFFMWR